MTIALSLGETFYASGRFAEAADACARGLDLLEEAGPGARDPLVEARLLAGLDTPGRLSSHFPEPVRLRMEALVAQPPPQPSPADRVLMAIAASEHAVGFAVPRDRVLQLARGALAGDVPDALGGVVVELAIVALVFCHEFGQAIQILDEVIKRARARGEAAAYVNLLALRGLAALARGPLDVAVAEADDAIRIASETLGASPPALAPARHVLAIASLERGESEHARRAVDVPDAADLWERSSLYGWFLCGLGRVELASGRHREALAAFRAAGARFISGGGPGTFCDWRSGAALAALGAGSREEALAFADEELHLARAFGAPSGTGIALRSRALVCDQADESITMLRDAVELLASSDAAVEHARALVELGAALRRAGWDRDSREPLRAGMEDARRRGAHALVERAVAELEASGARRPRLARNGLESLTPSQRRVAGMAARGMSNREIAAALFVTHRTVETHLTAAYAKLGISSRDGLPPALAADPGG